MSTIASGAKLSKRVSVRVMMPEGSPDHFAHFLYDFVWPVYHWLYTQGRLQETELTILVDDRRVKRFEGYLKQLFNCSFQFEPTRDEIEEAFPILLHPMESGNRRTLGIILDSLIRFRSEYLCDFQYYVFDKLGVRCAVPASRIVLVERKVVKGRDEGGGRRHIVNHEAVRSAVEELACELNLAFQNVVLEDMTLQEQVEAFANAKAVVGQHGAGLHHVLWMPEGSLLFEVHDTNSEEYRLYRVCNFFGKVRHWNMVCTRADAGTTQGSIIVPVESLKVHLRKNLEGR